MVCYRVKMKSSLDPLLSSEDSGGLLHNEIVLSFEIRFSVMVENISNAIYNIIPLFLVFIAPLVAIFKIFLNVFVPFKKSWRSNQFVIVI